MEKFDSITEGFTFLNIIDSRVIRNNMSDNTEESIVDRKITDIISRCDTTQLKILQMQALVARIFFNVNCMQNENPSKKLGSVIKDINKNAFDMHKHLADAFTSISQTKDAVSELQKTINGNEVNESPGLIGGDANVDDANIDDANADIF